jgi:hypothetical protein
MIVSRMIPGELGPQRLGDLERGRRLPIEHRQHDPEQVEPRVLVGADALDEREELPHGAQRERLGLEGRQHVRGDSRARVMTLPRPAGQSMRTMSNSGASLASRFGMDGPRVSASSKPLTVVGSTRPTVST